MPLSLVLVAAVSAVLVLAVCVVARRGRRSRRRSSLLAAHRGLQDDRATTDERIREALAALSSRGSTGRPDVLFLGLGAICVSDEARGVRERRIPDAPLLVRVDAGVRVLGPPPLARQVVESYRRRLGADSRGSPASSVEAVEVSTPMRPGAEVWIGPDGICAARTPEQAGGRWVPLELRL